MENSEQQKHKKTNQVSHRILDNISIVLITYFLFFIILKSQVSVYNPLAQYLFVPFVVFTLLKGGYVIVNKKDYLENLSGYTLLASSFFIATITAVLPISKPLLMQPTLQFIGNIDSDIIVVFSIILFVFEALMDKENLPKTIHLIVLLATLVGIVFAFFSLEFLAFNNTQIATIVQSTDTTLYIMYLLFGIIIWMVNFYPKVSKERYKVEDSLKLSK